MRERSKEELGIWLESKSKGWLNDIVRQGVAEKKKGKEK